MADTPTTTDTTATAEVVATDSAPATPPAASTAPPKMFTQEDLNRVAATAREEGKRSAQKPATAPKPAQVEPPKPAPAADAAMTTADFKLMLERERKVTAFVTRRGLDAAQEASIRSLVEVANPSSPETWLEETFGPMLGKPPAPQAVQSTAQAAPATTATTPSAPAAAPAAPTANVLPTSNGLLDPFSMTTSQHQALGPAGMRGALEALWKIGNQMSGAPERPKPPSQR